MNTALRLWRVRLMICSDFIHTIEQGAICNVQGRRTASQYIFQHIIKNAFSKCHQTLKRIAVGLPPGAANYIPLLSVSQT